MIAERLQIMRDLLSDDGSIYVHLDSRLIHPAKLIMDEVFGPDQFLNHIIWSYRRWPSTSRNFQTMHDDILFYSKSQSSARTFVREYEAASESYERRFKGKTQVLDPETRTRKITVDEATKGLPLRDVWELSIIAGFKAERIGYPTQKPESLLERVIGTSSEEGDIVADFFCGSGTTLAVAEKLGRKWIGCDLGRFAVHTSRKRLIGVQRQLKAEGKPYRAFEILNLGKYERQYFVGIDPTLPDDERIERAIQRQEQYLSLILTAYKAERVYQLRHVQGRKGSTLVFVGPVDAPVTLSDVNEIVEECVRSHWPKVDVLGFEFEMGLHPYIQDEARQRGVSLALKHVPKDVFDKRAIERNQVQFYDVAYVEAVPTVQGLTATVTLNDFGVFYGQDEGDALAVALKPGGSRVAVENGRVVKVAKDKAGGVTREVLTKQWTDWVDYWAVDFDFTSKPEIVTVQNERGEEREVRTGNHIFENEWQSFRTKKDRRLELTSAPHVYPKPGTYKIAVKVIDIFGNDTTKVAPVEVKG